MKKKKYMFMKEVYHEEEEVYVYEEEEVYIYESLFVWMVCVPNHLY